MLSKANKSQASHKKEVAEKVKEIKQRQHNWFKQRDESRQKGPPSQAPVAAKPKKVDKDPFTPQQHSSNSTNRTINRQTVTVKNSKFITNDKNAGDKAAGFHAWRSRQGQSLKGSTESQDEGGDSDYAETESTDIPVYSDEESYRSEALSRVPSSQADVMGGTLSPDQFDALADQIVTRVKKELRVDTSGKSDKNYRQETKNPPQNQEKRYLQQTDNRQTTTGLDSHFCTSCAELMMPPKFEPMLVIPCGHTLCCRCLAGQSACPLCGCDINSLTCNIMLQQIIIDYKKNPQRNTTNKKGAFKTEHLKHGAVQKENHSEPERDYEEEYRTLMIRCEVLKAEEESINERILGFKQKAKQEQVQIESIVMEEKRVEEQIDQLHLKLEALRAHRGDYIEKGKGIKRKEEEERSKLKLCHDTLTQLKKDAEKIRHMADILDYGDSY